MVSPLAAIPLPRAPVPPDNGKAEKVFMVNSPLSLATWTITRAFSISRREID
jgi:hypothetical protein